MHVCRAEMNTAFCVNNDNEYCANYCELNSLIIYEKLNNACVVP